MTTLSCGRTVRRSFSGSIHWKSNRCLSINRVAKVLELTTVDEWNYVKSCDNPADAGTRGLSANSLGESPGLKGPSFLRTHDWPFKPPKEVEIKVKAKKSDTPNSEETSEFRDSSERNGDRHRDNF